MAETAHAFKRVRRSPPQVDIICYVQGAIFARIQRLPISLSVRRRRYPISPASSISLLRLILSSGRSHRSDRRLAWPPRSGRLEEPHRLSRDDAPSQIDNRIQPRRPFAAAQPNVAGMGFLLSPHVGPEASLRFDRSLRVAHHLAMVAEEARPGVFEGHLRPLRTATTSSARQELGSGGGFSLPHGRHLGPPVQTRVASAPSLRLNIYGGPVHNERCTPGSGGGLRKPARAIATQRRSPTSHGPGRKRLISAGGFVGPGATLARPAAPARSGASAKRLRCDEGGSRRRLGWAGK